MTPEQATASPPTTDQAAERVAESMDLASPEIFLNRELSWLGFARRVLALVEATDLPLVERLKFAGISGMLHDEFFMKRVSGLKRQIRRRSSKRSLDGRAPDEEFAACRTELVDQALRIGTVLERDLRPALAAEGLGIHEYRSLSAEQQRGLREYFAQSVLPILTPLAVDPEHPFPFISNLGLNLAVVLPDDERGRHRFVRIKVPNNRPRWVPLPDGSGSTPLEQVIAENLDLLYPDTPPQGTYPFRLTRGAEGDPEPDPEVDEASDEPGSIVRMVSRELKARRFAGPVRLQVPVGIPERLSAWMGRQLGIDPEDIYTTTTFLGLSDLLELAGPERPQLLYPDHVPVVHPRLRKLDPGNPDALFRVIRSGDVLLHHPYDDFESSVLRFIQDAARDRTVLAIKLTIYRTSRDSPIVRALAEAARQGKQVAVLVEITARFDEAPNIQWGKLLENEGAHVAYGVERLKTHVKLALVVREEAGQICHYAHIGTGNYHPGTAKVYEDLGILTANPDICAEVAAMFNGLTGTTPYPENTRMLIAPSSMLQRFLALIRREAEHAEAGRPCGIYAKMNQLQDPDVIRELYRASRVGVPITLNVRGLCCLRPGVPGLSESIRVYSVVGRFLEHSRLYRFTNGGDAEYYMGSADWMHRNLANRIETVVPVLDPALRHGLDAVIQVYETDNCSAWDCGPDGTYLQRRPETDQVCLAAQNVFLERARDK
ncbi:MAG: polyphosphate kinase 1 [Gemmatimonadota bacterium]|nr:polyphosphate kinase 1 [Gemmatimonadota bacterium]MDH5198559.1 polyphosphate kinase 1 [Gemmatimonadota bacterium]